jgi:hypothetical protein
MVDCLRELFQAKIYLKKYDFRFIHGNAVEDDISREAYIKP